eukprot:m.159657 g.159657  ORF g.159657 m.159657 type:complete len:169 (+) comp31144_c0_seq1:633-1139(+)
MLCSPSGMARRTVSITGNFETNGEKAGGKTATCALSVVKTCAVLRLKDRIQSVRVRLATVAHPSPLLHHHRHRHRLHHHHHHRTNVTQAWAATCVKHAVPSSSQTAMTATSASKQDVQQWLMFEVFNNAHTLFMFDCLLHQQKEKYLKIQAVTTFVMLYFFNHVTYAD